MFCPSQDRNRNSHQENKNQDQGDPVSSPHQAEGSSLKKRSEWREVHVHNVYAVSYHAKKDYNYYEQFFKHRRRVI